MPFVVRFHEKIHMLKYYRRMHVLAGAQFIQLTSQSNEEHLLLSMTIKSFFDISIVLHRIDFSRYYNYIKSRVISTNCHCHVLFENIKSLFRCTETIR